MSKQCFVGLAGNERRCMSLFPEAFVLKDGSKVLVAFERVPLTM